MHARLTAVNVPPDQADSAIATFRDNVVPAAKEMGARGAVLFVNRETGEGLGFTLWEDEAAMRASEEHANELRRSITGQMGVTQEPRVERYEVAVFETS